MAYGTVDIDRLPAGPADEVVMVVAHAGLVAGGRPRWLDAAKDSLLRQQGENVVDRLSGNRPDLVPHHSDDLIGRSVGPR